jgi:cell division protein FtsX
VKIRIVIVAAILVAAAAVTTVLLLNRDSTDDAAAPRLCLEIDIFFKADADMTRAADRLRTDPDVTKLVVETKQQSFERYKRLFADQPELLQLVRVEAMPARVGLEPAHNMNRVDLANKLKPMFPAGEVQDSCEYTDRLGPR